jgi:hypothetical protein
MVGKRKVSAMDSANKKLPGAIFNNAKRWPARLAPWMARITDKLLVPRTGICHSQSEWQMPGHKKIAWSNF